MLIFTLWSSSKFPGTTKMNAKICVQPGHMSSARGARHRSWNGRSMESTSYTEEMRMRPIPRAPPALRVLRDALRCLWENPSMRFLLFIVFLLMLFCHIRFCYQNISQRSQSSLSLSDLVLCNLDSRATRPTIPLIIHAGVNDVATWLFEYAHSLTPGEEPFGL